MSIVDKKVRVNDPTDEIARISITPAAPTSPPPDGRPPADTGGADDDDFDPEKLRLSQDFVDSVAVQKVLTHLPVRKPGRDSFVRTTRDQSLWYPTAVLETEADKELYLVDNSLRELLQDEPGFGPRVLVPTMDRQGTLFLWPLKLPRNLGRTDNWAASSREVAEIARDSWVRVRANMNAGCYEAIKAPALKDEPVWPELVLKQLLAKAFHGRHVKSWDDPVLKRLRGEE